MPWMPGAPHLSALMWRRDIPVPFRREGARLAHDGAVVGLAPDACNALLLTGGRDGTLRAWGFKSRKPAGEMEVGSPLTRLAAHAGSALLAAAAEDLVIRM